MAISPTIGFPVTIEAGNYAGFLVAFADYSPNDFAGAFVVSRGTVAPISTAATPSGTAFLVEPTTSTLPLGKCEWAFYVTQSGKRLTAATGVLTVIPSLTTTATPSPAQAMLTVLEATITTLSSSKNQSVNFNGQSYTKRDMGPLLNDRARLQAEVAREKAEIARARGGRDPGRIAIEFVPLA